MWRRTLCWTGRVDRKTDTHTHYKLVNKSFDISPCPELCVVSGEQENRWRG